MSNPCLDAVTKELEAVGARYTVEPTSKHIHIHYGAELQHLHVVATSPSDWRAPLSAKSQIRRELKAFGFMPDETETAPERSAVLLVEGEPSCYSYDIAADFGKAHKDVLRAIDRVREECGSEFDQRNFAPIDYLDANSRKYRAYRMTRDGFSLVVMGFTGAAATAWKVKYIGAFNRLADQLQRLAAPPIDMPGIRDEIDALVALMGDVEARIAPPVAVTKAPFIHPRQIERQALRRSARRMRA